MPPKNKPIAVPEHLQRNLKSLRREAGVHSQEALAERIVELEGQGEPSLVRRRIAKIESGERRVTLADALEIAAALGIEPARLLFPDDTAPIELAPGVAVTSHEAREWLQGVRPLRTGDRANYFRGRSESLAGLLPLVVELMDLDRAGAPLYEQREVVARLSEALMAEQRRTGYYEAAMGHEASLRPAILEQLRAIAETLPIANEAVIERIEEAEAEHGRKTAKRKPRSSRGQIGNRRARR